MTGRTPLVITVDEAHHQPTLRGRAHPRRKAMPAASNEEG
jgi:hypothetical protein